MRIVPRQWLLSPVNDDEIISEFHMEDVDDKVDDDRCVDEGSDDLDDGGLVRDRLQ